MGDHNKRQETGFLGTILECHPSVGIIPLTVSPVGHSLLAMLLVLTFFELPLRVKDQCMWVCGLGKVKQSR